MYNCQTVVCPEVQFKLSKAQCPPNAQEETEMRDIPYAELVGCIQYLVVCTRPDLAHAASQISRFMQNPGKVHWTAALRVLRYLRWTLTHKLCFSKSPKWLSWLGFRMLTTLAVLTPTGHTQGMSLKLTTQLLPGQAGGKNASLFHLVRVSTLLFVNVLSRQFGCVVF